MDQFVKRIDHSIWDDHKPVGAYFSRDANNSCSCGRCSWFDKSTSCRANDYAVDWEPCCGGLCRQTLKCLPPQRQICGLSQDDAEVVNVSWSSVDPSTVGTSGPELLCTYDKTKFTADSLANYRKKFGKDSKYFEILTFLASRPATKKCLNPTCRTDPDGSTKCSSETSFGKCSILSENSHDGYLLRRELAQCSNAEKLDIIKTICGQTADFDDCRCFNKLIVDTNYAVLKKIHNFDDRCWYLPCVDSYSLSNYLNPPDIPAQCPTNMCQVIIDAAKNNNVDISKIQNTLNCSVQNNKPILEPPTPPPNFKPPSDSNEGSKVGKYIVIFSAALFVFLFFLFFFTKR